MSEFKDMLTEDLENVFFNNDEFAEAATYAGVTIQVIEAEIGEQNTSLPGFSLPRFSVLVNAADVPQPKSGDQVTFRGVSCVVGPFPRSLGDVWQVDLLTKAMRI